MAFRDIDEVKAANNGAGHHFFDTNTLRYFHSRVSETLYGGRYFVTSERDDGPYPAWDGQRRYTVREALPNGHIETIGEFGQYASRSGAHRAAQRKGSAE